MPNTSASMLLLNSRTMQRSVMLRQYWLSYFKTQRHMPFLNFIGSVKGSKSWQR